jgi:hypothetical protein
MIEIALGFVVGAGFGMMAYRYWLQRDPASLEAWAAKVKAASDAAKAKLNG